MLVEHRVHSARARCTRRGQVLHIDYSGVLSLSSLDELERRTLPDRRAASVSFERMDGAVMTLSGPIAANPLNYPFGTPPSAVIVPYDLYDRSIAYCESLARIGVLRVPFLPDEIDVALRWASCFSAGKTSLSV